ncbi:helix-turn-helix domain-containing protein [Dysgonomonas sp. Marseille-P4677]|uniref:helix-turn-helix domain-containing protein n=1 Tax=Dysgonomonas sp. Marseille-P4677 TaxID=2364790 RepID=UPI001911EDC6|nr:helix-turn-helix domain-containing protein [Dysgonomonas sp. Marseille-P4677]MBK5721220.1 helix-turn-helix domain-containing protein [Dysgonomonas sp. Marseille-P4677]
MSKYSEKLANEICRYMEMDFYSISEICTIFKISRKTFYEWRDSKPSFRKALDEAIKVRDEAMLITARLSLKKKLEGYTLTEEKVVYVPSKSDPSQLILKSKTVKRKECAPDTQTIKLILDREDKKQDENRHIDTPPTIVNVTDEHTAEQLRILYRNKGESGGSQKDFNDTGDFETVNIEEETMQGGKMVTRTKQVEIKHDPKANMLIVKGGSLTCVPPGYRR